MKFSNGRGLIDSNYGMINYGIINVTNLYKLYVSQVKNRKSLAIMLYFGNVCLPFFIRSKIAEK